MSSSKMSLFEFTKLTAKRIRHTYRQWPAPFRILIGCQGIIFLSILYAREDNKQHMLNKEMRPDRLDYARGLKVERLDKSTYVKPVIVLPDENVTDSSIASSVSASNNSNSANTNTTQTSSGVVSKTTSAGDDAIANTTSSFATTSDTKQPTETYYSYWLKMLYGTPTTTTIDSNSNSSSDVNDVKK